MTICAGACLAATCTLALPPLATAGGGERLVFGLDGSNGYKIHAIGREATAALVVRRARHRRDLGASGSIYIGRARTGPRRLEATVATLGRIDVRFRPSGRVTHGKRHRHCRGPDRYTTRYGVFVGTVRFRGEGSYTKAKAHRVKGKVVTPAVLRCAFFFGGPRTTFSFWSWLRAPAATALAGRPASEALAHNDLRAPPRLPRLLGGSGRRTALRASWRVGVAAQAFGAVQRGRRRPVFFAGAIESRERLAVVRLAAAVGSPADLLASSSLSTATVSPPAPFGGEGVFRHFDDGTKSWTGTLAVSFPGAPGVPLTGPPFEVGLSRGF